jgi:hypothetical protein
MEMMNTPTDYEERKLAFVELAKARAVAAETQKLLDDNPARYNPEIEGDLHDLPYVEAGC